MASSTAGAEDLGEYAAIAQVVPSVLKQANFPKPAKLFKIGYVGGWNTVSKKWFEHQKRLHAEGRAAGTGWLNQSQSAPPSARGGGAGRA